MTLECHSTRAAEVLLDEYAIETVICCDLPFKAHDENVTDHVVVTRRLWNAQLHDLVDNIEAQAKEKAGPDASITSDIAALGPATKSLHHKHDWASNWDWNGGPSKHPVTQCRTCNVLWTDVHRGSV